MDGGGPLKVNVDEDYKLLIGGEWVPTTDHYEIIDPNTTDVVGYAPETSTQQANDAATAAKAALKVWKRTPMAERCLLLEKAADLLEQRLPELAALVQAETGSTINVAETMQVLVPLERFRYYQHPREVDEPLKPYAKGVHGVREDRGHAGERGQGAQGWRRLRAGHRGWSTRHQDTA